MIWRINYLKVLGINENKIVGVIDIFINDFYFVFLWVLVCLFMD